MKLEDYEVFMILREKGIFDMLMANWVAERKKCLHIELKQKICCFAMIATTPIFGFSFVPSYPLSSVCKKNCYCELPNFTEHSDVSVFYFRTKNWDTNVDYVGSVIGYFFYTKKNFSNLSNISRWAKWDYVHQKPKRNYETRKLPIADIAQGNFDHVEG